MIKSIIDPYRAQKGYAGMMIFRDGLPLFCEGIEPEFGDRVKALFTDAETSYHSTSITAIILGFTVSATRLDDILIVSRFEGRFAPSPRIILEDTEYSTREHEIHLITREEARKAAEHLLQGFR